ncbi:MAG: DNA-binding protein [Flavobacterium psychrophilum]|nr:MAG: DNA-binding protein [Flavobacterium psychrophilum]
MKPFTFDQIPKLMGKLFDKMDNIESLLLSLNHLPNAHDQILNISEAAALLNLSVATIYSKVSRNEIPVCKKGKRLYFYKSELTDWIKSGKIATDQEIMNRR